MANHPLIINNFRLFHPPPSLTNSHTHVKIVDFPPKIFFPAKNIFYRQKYFLPPNIRFAPKIFFLPPSHLIPAKIFILPPKYSKNFFPAKIFDSHQNVYFPPKYLIPTKKFLFQNIPVHPPHPQKKPSSQEQEEKCFG